MITHRDVGLLLCCVVLCCALVEAAYKLRGTLLRVRHKLDVFQSKKGSWAQKFTKKMDPNTMRAEVGGLLAALTKDYHDFKEAFDTYRALGKGTQLLNLDARGYWMQVNTNESEVKIEKLIHTLHETAKIDQKLVRTAIEQGISTGRLKWDEKAGTVDVTYFNTFINDLNHHFGPRASSSGSGGAATTAIAANARWDDPELHKSKFHITVHHAQLTVTHGSSKPKMSPKAVVTFPSTFYDSSYPHRCVSLKFRFRRASSLANR